MYFNFWWKHSHAFSGLSVLNSKIGAGSLINLVNYSLVNTQMRIIHFSTNVNSTQSQVWGENPHTYLLKKVSSNFGFPFFFIKPNPTQASAKESGSFSGGTPGTVQCVNLRFIFQKERNDLGCTYVFLLSIM